MDNDKLKDFIKRILALDDEKKTISDDIKQVFDEAKAEGFKTKALKAAIALIKKDKDEREEVTDTAQEYVDVYETH